MSNIKSSVTLQGPHFSSLVKVSSGSANQDTGEEMLSSLKVRAASCVSSTTEMLMTDYNLKEIKIV